MDLLKTKAPLAARLVLGLIFTVFGLNGFLNFIPVPPPPEAGGAFLGALAATGYMFPLIKGLEVVAGVMLLSGRFVPLAITLLAPITVNIVLYHAVLAPGLAMPLVIVAAQAFLTYVHRASFAPLLRSQAASLDVESSGSAGEPIRAL